MTSLHLKKGGTRTDLFVFPSEKLHTSMSSPSYCLSVTSDTLLSTGRNSRPSRPSRRSTSGPKRLGIKWYFLSRRFVVRCEPSFHKFPSYGAALSELVFICIVIVIIRHSEVKATWVLYTAYQGNADQCLRNAGKKGLISVNKYFIYLLWSNNKSRAIDRSAKHEHVSIILLSQSI